ncbi:CHAT domain-containing tetratricopeptide repeat protein [Nonomuraea muscovyensis]|uniref:CHAT domain-containing tetratricopeptide repeat protein n=1 Tax=Nonomuraea muscovyensis TaxID=1124761 RepID=UPI003403EF18
MAEAEAAVSQAVVDPRQALDAGRQVLAAAETAGAVEAVVIALRAMALAARELGDLQAAEEHLRRAIAFRGAPRARLAQARLSLVTVRTERGHPLQALGIAALARPHLSPLDRAKLDTQRAVALAHLGRYAEAVTACDRAVATLTGAPGTIDDRRFLAGGLLNRGLVHAYRGDWDAATRDVAGCLRIARHAGLDHLSRLAAANLPFLAVRRGDIAGAFGHYQAAEDTLFGFPERLATMRADFAAALLAAHLAGEARELLSRAVPELEASGAQVALADARLKLAQAELLTGDARRALAVAERAERELALQGRRSWLPPAREVVLRARLALDGPTPALLAEVVHCAGELDGHTAHRAAAAALRLEAAEIALALGDERTATGQLARLAQPEGEQAAVAAPVKAAQVPGPVRHHALALEAELRGDPGGALRAVRDGLAEVGGQVRTFDDPALRAHAARAGARLAGLGLRLAVRDGGAEGVFAWAERWRALAGPADAGGPIDVGLVRDALGEAALVEFVAQESSLLALVVTGRGVRLRALGRIEAVTEAVIRLRYALRRHNLRDGALPDGTDPGTGPGTASGPGYGTGAGVASGPGHGSGSGRGSGAGGGLVRAAAEEVERLLLWSLAGDLEGRPMVVVPAGALYTLPWAALPGLTGRPVSVAASAAAWLAATRGARPAVAPPSSHPCSHPCAHPGDATPPCAGTRAGRLVVAAAGGPGLAHAREEVGRVLRLHPGGHEVPARAGTVLAALAGADVLHLAAHGVFHARSPLLSAITLEDGPLMAYDLLDVDAAARLVVLSACDSGMARTPAEGAPLGLAGTFLARGATCVVAGLVPVRDADALAVMTAFHGLLAAGRSPASALAAAAAETGVAGFACFGAGDQPVATGLPGSATQCDQEPT